PLVLHPVASTKRHVVVSDLGAVARRGGLGHVSGAVSLRSTQRRHGRPADDPGARAGRRGPEPVVAGAFGARVRRIPSLVDGDPGERAGVAHLRDRRAQYEVRLPGRIRQSITDLQLSEPGHADPDERWHTEPVDPDRRRGGPHQVRPQSHSDQLLRAGSMDVQAPDATGRPAIRLARLELSGFARWRLWLSVRARGDLLSESIDTWVRLEGPVTTHRRRVRSVREWEDGGQVQRGQVYGSHHGDQ